MKYLILLTLLFLAACGYEDTFSPTYHDNVCVPASALSFLENEPMQSQLAGDNNYQATTTTCCEGSWLTACCFGGNFICADGSTGVGCGCPSN